MNAERNLRPVETEDLPTELQFRVPVVFYISLFMAVLASVASLLGFCLLASSVSRQGKAIHRIEQGLKDSRNGLISLRTTVASRQREDLLFMKIIHLNRKVDRDLARKIAILVHKYSAIYNKDSDLVLALMHVESHFNPDAVSKMGAKGLMQLMPNWGSVFKIRGSMLDPETNIKHGLMILDFYEEMYKDINIALTVYNRGPSKVDWDLIHNRDPVNKYSEKVMRVYEQLKELNVG